MSQEIDEELMKVLIHSKPPVNAPLAAKYTESFAFPSMNKRAPVILTKIVDYLARDKEAIAKTYGEEVKDELKAAIGELSSLKNQLQTAKTFQPFASPENDTELWNRHILELTEKGDKINYYESNWLFAECYLYRSVREIFCTKKFLRRLDPFGAQKTDVLCSSLPVISPIFKYIFDEKIMDKSHNLSVDRVRAELGNMVNFSLWANQLDLSLSGGSVDINEDMLKQMGDKEKYMLVNDVNKVVGSLIGHDLSEDVINIVTDNSGAELLCDLILADFLVTRCGVGKVNFRVKPIPWFVSDVMLNDFKYTVDSVANSPIAYCQDFGNRWKKYLEMEKWTVEADTFWCLGIPYHDMKREDPQLYEFLKSSYMTIFKGDLNYRKLVRDLNWEPTVSFQEALGDFAEIRLVALRTCKADTVTGLSNGTAESVSVTHPDWLVSGEFGLIQINLGQN